MASNAPLKPMFTVYVTRYRLKIVITGEVVAVLVAGVV